jgi:hypothetical protein
MGVLVIGMHRSGTSALAGALDAMGLSAGKPDGLMRADRANPAGYYEQQGVADLNDEILSDLGGAWDCPPELTGGWSADPALAPFVSRAAELVDACMAGQNFVLKDPRIAILLPLWRRALLDRCSVVMIVRNPVEVAWSLFRRDGLPLLTGMALWASYNRAALAGLDGLPVHICSYEDLVTAPTPTLGEVAASLQAWEELPEPVDLDLASTRIQSKLRRDTWPRTRSELLDLPEEIAAFEKLLSERAGRHQRFECEKPAAPWWERSLFEERRQAVGLRQRLVDREGEIGSLRRRLADLEGGLADSTQKAATVELELHETGSALREVMAERDSYRSRLEQATLSQMALQTEVSLWKGRWDRVERRIPVRVYRALRTRGPRHS